MSVLSPEATPDKALRIFATLVRDQEVEGSNPFAPTTPFKINNLLLSNSTENANERLVRNHLLLSYLKSEGDRFSF
jgi:hypothetical protein